MWSKIWNAIRSVIEKMIGVKSVEQALHIQPVMSNKMEKAIELWDDMYRDEAPWLHEPTNANPNKIASLGIASFIASEKARTATIEMKSVITEPNSIATDADRNVKETDIPTNRAEYLNKQYQLHLIPHIRRQLEYGIAKGGLVIKPYVYDNTELQFIFCQADEFFPISFDTTGKMTEAVFTEKFTDKNNVYTRLEYHKLDLANKKVTIVNKAFRTIYRDTTAKDNELGTEIDLTSVEQWKDIQPVVEIQNVNRLLFAYFKMPESNTIDPTSPLGVSGFSRAVSLIKEADLQYSRMLWEYEGGEMAIDVDRDALKIVERTINGKKELVEEPNKLQSRLFRKIDLGTEQTYDVFAPNLRDSNYINGLNNILMRIEDVCGISRGTMSDITRSEAKTATEMLILRQRSYATNNDIQKALQKALDDTIYVMDIYSTLYNLAPMGEYNVSYEWDDSLISSPEEELQRRMMLRQSGIESRLNLRMWYYGETEEQAMLQLARVDQEQLQQAQLQALSTGLLQQATGGGQDTKGNSDNKTGQQEDQNKNNKDVE